MSAKTSAARRAAFFRVLTETGNHTIACERAKVSRSWVTLHKTTDPDFAAACDAAVAAALAWAREHGSPVPVGARYHQGEELVVRGGRGRRAVVARARLRQWTPSAEAAFLRTLAASCNVKASCAAAGLSVPSAYNRRNRWSKFRERWDAALEVGFVRLEMALIQNACNTFDPPEEDYDAPMPPVTVDQAIQLISLHKYAVRGLGKRPGRLPQLPSIEEVRAKILRKVEALARGRALQEADAGRDGAWPGITP